ncbi:MAG TPA: thioredoxin domain-containing protein [Actinomycetales bacterium]|nr:thioredoxin domain-containing protein [Actinomycetales bacterium]
MTSGKASRDQRAAKVKAQQAAMRKAESRRRNGIIAGAVVAVLVVVVGIGAIVQAGRNSTSSSSATPSNFSGDGSTSVVLGKESAPVTVTVFEDFQCPICQQFEQNVGPTMQQLRDAGTIKVEYRSIAFLDRMSTTSYSTRALNAAACVRDSSPDSFDKFHALLFENQPPENTAGLPDSKLIDLAKEAGATSVDSCIKDQKFKDWTVKVTDAASKDGVNGTPTVRVNGTELVNPSADQLKQAVEKAKG